MSINSKNADGDKNQNELSFDQFFLKRCEALEKDADYNGRRRLAMAILMFMRRKGDMFSFIPDADNYANLEYIPVSEAGLVKWNLFEPIVRANNANALNVKFEYVWEAATGDPDIEAGADIANSITETVRQRYYTEDKREGMCELAQLSHCFFLYTDWDKRKKSFKIRRAKKKLVNVPLGFERYSCPQCGYKVGAKDFHQDRELSTQMLLDHAKETVATAVGPDMLAGQPAPGEMPAGGDGEPQGQDPAAMQAPDAEQPAGDPAAAPRPGGGVPPGAMLDVILRHEKGEMDKAPPACPECGAEMESENTVTFQQHEVPDGFEEFTAGDFDDRLVSSFEVLIDERHGKRGNSDAAHWMCYRPLTPLYEVQSRYAGLIEELKHQSETDWSDSSQWLRALETSCDLVRRSNSELTGIDRLFEPKWWWFIPEACGIWKEPEGYELKDDDGNVIFDVKKSETVEAACIRNFGEFEGLRLEILGGRIVKVKSEYKNDRWKSGHWLVNALGFFGKGQEALLDLNTIVNEYVNMMYEHDMHESNPHTIIDGMMFDGEHFENRAGHISYTRPGFTREKGIDFYIKQLEPTAMSNQPFNLFSYILGPGKQDISGVTAGSVGTSDPNVRTAKGQQLTVQRALGMETPYFKSEKRAVRGYLENLTKLAQKNWPPEAYQYIKGGNGEELKDTDIEIFRKLQIGRDIILKDIEGTDIPQSNIEMRENYALAMQLGLFAPAAMSGVPPEIQSKMLKMLRIDYDADNYADHRRIAYDRVKKLKAEAEARFGEAMMPDGSIDPNLVMEILVGVPFLARQDAHMVHIGILDAFCVAESAKPNPNRLLIALLQGRAQQHGTAQQQAEQQGATQAAIAEGASERFRKVFSGETDEKNAERQDKTKQIEAGKKNDDWHSKRDDMPDETEIVRGLLESHNKERDREHVSREKAKDRKHDAAEKAKDRRATAKRPTAEA